MLDEYAVPLRGDQSLEDLTAFIDETMPADDPDLLGAADARHVAEHLLATFYRAPLPGHEVLPRIELARLTVRQYQNAAADLLRDFTGEAKLEQVRAAQRRVL